MYKENLVILLTIGIIVIKNKETRVIVYTCRYSSGQLIPISVQSVAVAELISLGIGYHPYCISLLFIYLYDPS